MRGAAFIAERKKRSVYFLETSEGLLVGRITLKSVVCQLSKTKAEGLDADLLNYVAGLETLKLRYVHLSDGLAIRFHEGMTRANTYSHDNPAAETVETPEPGEFEKDLLHLEKLIADLDVESKDAEGRRPAMKPEK